MTTPARRFRTARLGACRLALGAPLLLGAAPLPSAHAQTNVPVPERRSGPARPTLGTIPKAFTDLTLDRAEAVARERNLFLIVVSAGPTPDSRKLDLNTWPNEFVASWLERNALLVRLEAPKNAEAIARLGLDEVPSCVALVDGIEVGRFSAYKAPNSMPPWFASLSRSDGYIEALTERVRALDEAGAPAARATLDLAQALLVAQRPDEAIERITDLWERRGLLGAIDRPRLHGLVASIARTDAGRTLVEGWRDDLAGDPEHNRRELIVLAGALDEPTSIRAWIDDPAREAGDADPVFDLLEPIELYDGARLGRLVGDPGAIVERLGGVLVSAAQAGSRDPVAWRREALVNAWSTDTARRLANLQSSLLCADREDEARSVAGRAVAIFEALTLDPDVVRRALVTGAVEAHAVRRWHLDLAHAMREGTARDAIERPVRSALGLPPGDPPVAPE